MKNIIYAVVFSLFTAVLLQAPPLLQPAHAATIQKEYDINSDLSLKDSIGTSTLNNGNSAKRRTKATLKKKLEKKNYRADESIAVSFNNPDNNTLNMQVLNANDDVVDIALNQTTSGGITTLEVLPSNEIKPGEYTLVVTSADGKMLEQDFSWGVLAINTNKSYYKPGEKAHLEFAVLNEFGNMVCDVKLSLKISNDQLGVNDELSTQNGDITVNPECYSHNFTLKPDYEATYVTRQEGTYHMTLTAQTANKTYTIRDILTVDDSVAFDVERITATRIYPSNSYPVIFKITANEDFDGIIKESVPGSFFTSPFTQSTQDVSRDVYINEVRYDEEGTALPTTEDPIEETLTNEQDKDEESESASPSADIEATQSAYIVEDSVILDELKPLMGHTQISLAMPFTDSYPITQQFGVQETDPLLLTKYLKYGVIGHDGVDFALPRRTPILAADRGKVIYAASGDYGNTVIIQHSWGRSYYGHLDEIQIPLRKVVNKGEQLGLSGNTGLSTGPHLHFGIKPTSYDDHNGYFGKVDPLMYINNDITQAVAGTATQSINKDGLTQVTSIEYPLKLKKGESAQVEYRYFAPPKSPEAYLLGPLQFVDKNNDVVFEESRQWQIAADAVWLSTDWAYRKLITIDAADVSDADTANLSDFPFAISLASDTELAANALDSAFDIVFTSSDGSTKIPHEIETFNGGTGALFAWVNIPTLDYNDNTLVYMYYGNSGSCNQELSSCTTLDGTKNMNTTWTNASFAGVWHMEETPSTQPTDSTGNGLTLTYKGTWGSGQSVTAKVSKGLDFNGSNDYLTTADYANFDTATYTVSAWMRVDAFNSGLNFWFKHMNDPCCPDYSYRHYFEGSADDPGRFSLNWANTTPTDYFANGEDSGMGSGRVLLLSTFGYVSQMKTSNSFKFYMNGTDVSSAGNPTTSGSTRNANNDLCIGADCNPFVGINLFNGVMDELRIANTTRTTGWVQTEYTNQNSPSSTYTVGTQECQTPPSNDKLLRHGQYFDACGRHAYTW